MRKLTLGIAVLATALTAGVVSAQTVNPGIAQLAASVGVSPSAFTPNQLIRLEQAQRDNDRQTIDFIIGEARGTVSRSDMGASVSAGDAQLAAVAGVEPGQYTTAELIRLIDAQRDNNSEVVNFILSGTNRTGDQPASAVTPGEAQLAATLGVDPADYTLAELSKLYADTITD